MAPVLQMAQVLRKASLLAAVLGSTVLGTVGAVASSVATSQTASAAIGGTGRFNPVAPSRLIDTRRGARPGAGSVVHVQVAGRSGVPSSALAVVVNLTATDAAGAGFLAVYPSGTTRPNVSNLNLANAGDTLANLSTVPLGADGGIDVYTDAGTHIIVDLFGWYEQVGATDRGRFQPLTPSRAYDSRSLRPVGRGGTLRVNLPSVPASASAAVVNVTAVDAPGGGFWTAYAAGSVRPETSNLNVSPGATVPNQVIVPVTGSAIELFSDVGGHVLVDVVGYYTGVGAASSSVGLFTPIVPTRFLDTRGADNPLGNKVKPYAGWTVEVAASGRAGIPSGISAIVTNTTMTGARGAGFVTVYPAGMSRPTVSNLNLGYSGQTVANHAITPVSARGAAIYTDHGGHLLVDVAGYFSGSVSPSNLAAPINPEPIVELPGQLYVPRLGLNTTLHEGIDIDTVNEGPGHWPGTASPGGLGNMTVFGHRVSHTHPFRDVDRLLVGDSIYVTAEGVTYRYEVMRTDVTSPDNIAILSPYDSGTRTLTLIACHPPTSVSYRIVVKAKFVEITAS
jgi:LPXTG-site transpeptidase (sortase) family protein